jgi:hypothetical protein
MMDVNDQRSDDVERPCQLVEHGVRREESVRMESEMVVSGAIVDSWVESARTASDATRLVLQVAPRERPKDLVIVEAEASLVPDRFWLEDLSENLCHGSPVLAVGRRSFNGFMAATRLQLAR